MMGETLASVGHQQSFICDHNLEHSRSKIALAFSVIHVTFRWLQCMALPSWPIPKVKVPQAPSARTGVPSFCMLSTIANASRLTYRAHTPCRLQRHSTVSSGTAVVWPDCPPALGRQGEQTLLLPTMQFACSLF